MCSVVLTHVVAVIGEFITGRLLGVDRSIDASHGACECGTATDGVDVR